MILGMGDHQFWGGGVNYGAGMETISCGSSSNGGGHWQSKVRKVVGGKVVFRGSHFSLPLYLL